VIPNLADPPTAIKFGVHGMEIKMYYTIFIRKGKVEYHVSLDRGEAERGESMSRRIDTSSPHAAEAIIRWLADARTWNCEYVEYIGD
jgi:hypothetical protein